MVDTSLDAAAVHGPVANRPKIAVVPLKGLPFSALALALVVTAIATNWKWLLMFSHVVGGATWTALDLFVGLVIGPIMGAMSIPARAEFAARFMPKMVIIMPTIVTMNLGAGFQIARLSGNLAANSPNHAWLIASFVVVGIMAAIALGVLEPANIAVIYEMNKPVPNGKRIEHLMKRFIFTAGITGLMQVATLVIMTRLASR